MNIVLDRKNRFFETFSKKDKIKDNEEKDENLQNHDFNIHFSNIFNVSNYFIGYFPYSFVYIEIEGDGFDDPNRIFNSIELGFYNSMKKKSDLRELIPEFFYLAKIFMNINAINFEKNADNILVDDVIMPKEFGKL